MADEVKRGRPRKQGGVVTSAELQGEVGPDPSPVITADSKGDEDKVLTEKKDKSPVVEQAATQPSEKENPPEIKPTDDIPEEKSVVVDDKEKESEIITEEAPVIEKPVIVEEKKGTLPNTVFECPYAQTGECNIALPPHNFEGKVYDYQLTLINKRFVIPGEWDEETKRRHRQALRANGFIDVTVLEAGAVLAADGKKLVYRVAHPDHTDRNRINGKVSLVLMDDNRMPMYHKEGDKAGQQITEEVNIINGMAYTDDKQVYEALLRAGFVHAGTRIKED